MTGLLKSELKIFTVESPKDTATILPSGLILLEKTGSEEGWLSQVVC
jgi:hypothetical protein